jgi:CelD/BcsL family acetyltransferase involved in cellulose biosynthesis
VFMIRQVDNFEEFEHLGLIWNDLLQRSKDNDIFSTWEWLSCWWKHFGKDRELRVLIAEENGKIMAIAPLMLSKYNFMNFGRITGIEFIGSPHSDYNNLIWFENERQSLRLFMEHLAQETDWDSLELRDVREGTLSEKLLREPHAKWALELKDRTMSICPYLELPSTIEEFMARLRPSMRQQVRRTIRRLKDRCQVGVKVYSEFDSIQEAMDRFFDLHQKRWTSKGKTGDFESSAVRAFHIDLAQRLSAKGWLALSFLTVDEETVAANYSFDYEGKRYFYQSGFDPGFAAYSVGTLLHLKNIEMCMAKGLREYDFMRGGDWYKLRWPTKVRRNFEAYVVRRGWFAKLRRTAKQNQTMQALVQRLGKSLVLEP